MDEKTLVSDALVGINGELKMFGDMIPQTENKELKQCLKQIRNQCEMAQEKMYTAAREKSLLISFCIKWCLRCITGSYLPVLQTLL